MSDEPSLRQLVERMTSRPGYTSSIGTRIIEVAEGRVVFGLDRRKELVQFSGYFHGGIIAGLADHAAGAAVTTALPSDRIPLTIDLNTHFLAPADGESLLATARAVRIGTTICVATVDVETGAPGALRMCAIATVTLRVTSRTFQ